ncbi:MAG: nodulation protein NodZ, partial [bacterium]
RAIVRAKGRIPSFGERGLILEKNKYLLVKGIAGLGNRILCLLTAILYARLTGRRLLVDWRDPSYSEDGANVFHRYFLCKLCNARDEIPITGSIRPNIWRGHLHDSAGSMEYSYAEVDGNPEIWRKFSVDLSKIDYPEEVLVMWSYYAQLDELRTHFRDDCKDLRWTSTKAILRNLMREHLILHPSIQQRVDRFKARRFNRKTVGVHVRYTDKKTRLPAILRKLEALLRREPGLQIFLATDSLQVHNIFTEKYSCVVSTPKWYPTTGISMHQNPACPNRTEEGVSALMDLYLLAACDYLILDESSSFSYLASLLTNAGRSHVFNVQRGRLLPSQVRHLLWLITIRLHRGLHRAWRKNGCIKWTRSLC